MFRDAFNGPRSIIPASGFYEWSDDKGGKAAKQPHLFTAADGSPILAFAGLWDRWHDRAAGEEVLACMAIVCERICNCLKATAASATAAWSS
jgi:putative SOS response-associated peptidase YedK